MNGVVRIRIFPHGAVIAGDGPARVLDLVDAHEERAAVGLPFSCRGGTCGVCRVRVLRGAELIEPAQRREREVLHFAQAAADERLGCQLMLRADAAGELELALSPTSAPAGS